MRIMTADLKIMPHFRPERTESGYVGTEKKLNRIKDIAAQVTPVTDRASAEVYGEKITKMRSLLCDINADIKCGDYVALDGLKLKVVSVMRYSTHLAVLAEFAGNVNGN